MFSDNGRMIVNGKMRHMWKNELVVYLKVQSLSGQMDENQHKQ
jgi:hypothetical protein